jgi:hypothetical protein
VGSHCPRCPKALVSPSAAALYSAVINLRPESRETDRSWFCEPAAAACQRHPARSSRAAAKLSSRVSNVRKFKPNGFLVSSRMAAARSMMRRAQIVATQAPRPPAFDTAATKAGDVAEPMPPSAIGCSMFNRSQTAVLIMISTLKRNE